MEERMRMLNQMLKNEIEREVNKVNQNSCAICDKRAERKQQISGWALRCVGATASAAFHVGLTVGVVYAVMQGNLF